VLNSRQRTFPAILFLPRSAMWCGDLTGHMYSPEEASQISGIKEIWEDVSYKTFPA